MKYLLLALALAGCTTTKHHVEIECLKAKTDDGETYKVCPMPAGILCFDKDGQISCLQVQESRSY